jgi:hypothetical protein
VPGAPTAIHESFATMEEPKAKTFFILSSVTSAPVLVS